MPNDSGARTPRPLVRPTSGAGGATATILGALPPTEWTVFGQVRLPAARPGLQVAVGPQGVFVVDSRPQRRVGGRDELRPGGVRQDVVVGASRAAMAVAALSGLVPPRDVVPVVCFLGREVEPVVAGDVVVCSSRNLLAVLTGGPVVLDDARRQLLTMDLDASLGTPAGRRTRPRRWLRSQLLGLVLAALASVGLWQVAQAAAGPDRPAVSTSAAER